MASNNYISDTFSRLDQSREARNASLSSWEAYQRTQLAHDRAARANRDERYTLLTSQRAAATIPPPPPREIEYIFPIYLFEHDEDGNREDEDPKIIGYCKSLNDVVKFVTKLANLSKFRGLFFRHIESGESSARYGFVDVSKPIYAYTIVSRSIKFDELLL